MLVCRLEIVAWINGLCPEKSSLCNLCVLRVSVVSEHHRDTEVAQRSHILRIALGLELPSFSDVR